MNMVKTTDLGFIAYLTADAFRWTGGANAAPIARGAIADALILRTYRETLECAHKPLAYTLNAYVSATRAAIECFAQMHVSGPPARRSA